MDTLSVKLTKLRVQKGETYKETADAVGLSKALIYQLERGEAKNPTMKVVVALANHFGVSIGYLVDEDPDLEEDQNPEHSVFRQAKDLSKEQLKHVEALIKSFASQNEAG